MITKKIHIYITCAVAISGSLLYFYFDPALSLFPPCPFYSLTGLFCPGCGSQRAFHDLLHGHLSDAADHNVLLVAALPLVGFSALATLRNVYSKKKIEQRIFNSSTFAIAVLFLTVAFWILRNVPYAPFRWLAP